MRNVFAFFDDGLNRRKLLLIENHSKLSRRSLMETFYLIVTLAMMLPPGLRPNGQSAPPNLQLDSGTHPYASYYSDKENISLTSGNLNINVPLLHLPGRAGHDLDLSVSYNSQIFYPVKVNVPGGPPGGNGSETFFGVGYTMGDGYTGPGWNFSVPRFTSSTTKFVANTAQLNEGPPPPSCQGTDGLDDCLYGLAVMYDPDSDPTRPYYCQTSVGYTDWDGANYTFDQAVFGCIIIDGSSNNGVTGGATLDRNIALDDQGASLVFDGSQYVLQNQTASFMPRINFPNGRRITQLWDSPTLTMSYVDTDANGNMITYATSGSTGLQTITDTLGRVVTLARSPVSGGNITTVSYVNGNGQTENITLNFTSPRAGTIGEFPYIYPGPPGAGANARLNVIGQLSSIVLPSGLTYIFQYDPLGNLIKLVYPTGGYTRYDYGFFTHFYSFGQTNNGAPQLQVTAKYECTAVASSAGALTVDPGNTCPQSEYTTSYSPTVDATTTNNTQEVVVRPDGTSVTTTYLPTTYSSTQLADGTICCTQEPPAVQTETTKDASNNVVKAVTYTYPAGSSIHPSSRTVAIDGVTSSEETWTYQQTNVVAGGQTLLSSGETNTVWDTATHSYYDYGVGGVGALMKTESASWISPQFARGGLFLAHLKASDSVFSGSNATDPFAKTTYQYDTNPLFAPAGVSAQEHDGSYATILSRGNITEISGLLLPGTSATTGRGHGSFSTRTAPESVTEDQDCEHTHGA